MPQPSVHLSLRLPPPMKQEIARNADAMGMACGAYVRYLLRRGLEWERQLDSGIERRKSRRRDQVSPRGASNEG